MEEEYREKTLKRNADLILYVLSFITVSNDLHQPEPKTTLDILIKAIQVHIELWNKEDMLKTIKQAFNI